MELTGIPAYTRNTNKESRMTTTRREVLSARLAAAGAAVTPSLIHASTRDSVYADLWEGYLESA